MSGEERNLPNDTGLLVTGAGGFIGGHLVAEFRRQPDTSLRAGLEKTYAWIYDQYMARERSEPGVVRESKR